MMPLFVVRRLRLLVGHFQKEQKRDLLGVSHVGKPIIAQGITMEFLGRVILVLSRTQFSLDFEQAYHLNPSTIQRILRLQLPHLCFVGSTVQLF